MTFPGSSSVEKPCIYYMQGRKVTIWFTRKCLNLLIVALILLRRGTKATIYFCRMLSYFILFLISYSSRKCPIEYIYTLFLFLFMLLGIINIVFTQILNTPARIVKLFGGMKLLKTRAALTDSYHFTQRYVTNNTHICCFRPFRECCSVCVWFFPQHHTLRSCLRLPELSGIFIQPWFCSTLTPPLTQKEFVKKQCSSILHHGIVIFIRIAQNNIVIFSFSLLSPISFFDTVLLFHVSFPCFII